MLGKVCEQNLQNSTLVMGSGVGSKVCQCT